MATIGGVHPLAQILSGQPMVDYQSSPIYQGGYQLAQTQVPMSRRANPWAVAAGRVAQGFAGGLMMGYGKKYAENEAATRARDAIRGMQTGEFSDPTVQSSIELYDLMQKHQMGLEAEGKRKELELTTPYEIKKSLAAKGMQQADDGSIAEIPNYANVMAKQAGAEARAKADVEASTAPGIAYKTAVSRKLGELEAESQALTARGGKLSPDKLREYETVLRKEFTSRPEYVDYSLALKNYKSMLRALKDDSAMADVELVFGVMQSIEPGGIVRDGERIMVTNSQSALKQYEGLINKALTGGGAVRQQARDAIMRLGQRRYRTHRDAYESALRKYSNRIEKVGGRGQELTNLDEPIPYASELPAGQRLVVDKQGRIVVVDSENNKIREYK